MTVSLKVLIVEDHPNDAELIVHALHRSGFEPIWQRVDSEDEYLERLDGDLDLILADYTLPGFSGLHAFHLLRQRGLDIPFIVVTGSLEEAAIEAMKAGAADYLLKDRLGRLGEAVRRALQERALRQEKRQAEIRTQAFLGLGQRLSTAVTAQEAARVIMDVADELLGWDAATLDHYLPEQDRLEPVLTIDTMNGRRVDVAPAYTGTPSPVARRTLEEGGQLILRDPSSLVPPGLIPFGDTSRPSASLMFVPVRYGKRVNGILSIQSYSPRVYDEESLELLQALADHCGGALDRIQATEQVRFQAHLLDAVGQAVIATDLEGKVIYWNRFAETLYGWSAAEAVGDNILRLTPAPRSEQQAMEIMDRLRAGESWSGEILVQRRDGSSFPALVTDSPVYGSDDEVVGIVGVSTDISERKQAEIAEREQRAFAQALTDTAAFLNSTLDLDEVLERILDNVGRVVTHDAANIMFVASGKARVVRYRGYGKQQDFGHWPADWELRLEGTASLTHMVEDGQPLVIPDTRAYPGWREWPQTQWIRAYVGAPIQREGEVIGFLNLYSAQVSFFTAVAGRRLQAFADQVAIAINNAWLFEAEQQQRRIEATLRQAAAVLNSTLALEEVLVRILEQLAEAIPHDSASVQQLESKQLVVRAVRGFPEPVKITGLTIPATGNFPNTYVVNRKEPLALADVAARYPHFRDEPDVYAAARVRSWLGVPMIINDEVIGMITVDRNEIWPFTDEEVELAVAFANHAATALQNARLYQEMETYSDVLEQAVEERTIELKRTMERTEAILQNNPDAVLLLRADGTIETGNRAFHQIFGYPLSEAYDRLPSYLICPGYTESFTRALQKTISAARMMRFDVEGQRKDGTTFDVDVALAPIKQKDSVIGVVCSLRDISALKEVERMKDAFVSNVSHELRSPITSLKLNRDLLVLNPKKQDVYLHRLAREIDRLHVIVEDILRLSRLDQEPAGLKVAPVDLNELAAQYVDDRRPLAESRNLTLALEQDLTVRPVSGDKGLIGQVLSILLTNAFNYTPAGGRIVVQTAACQLDEKQWTGFSVSDTGPGISQDEIPYLFDRFYRGRVGKDSGAAGTGLGLSITREIVDRHDGRIEVISEGIPGNGATFTVWLPAVEPTME